MLTSALGEAAPEKVRYLTGHYKPAGVNHAKPVFRKQSSEDEPVWLYYWDARDGHDFSGWWLGQAVGGAEVFARCPLHTAEPPVRTWRIPHDGEPRPDVSVVPAGPAAEAEAEAPMRVEELAEEVKVLVVAGERSAEKAVAAARAMMQTSEDGAARAKLLLKARASELQEVKPTVLQHLAAARRQGISAEVEGELLLLEERLDSITGICTRAIRTVEERLRQFQLRRSEESDAKVVEDRLLTVMEQVAEAELQAEVVMTKAAAEGTRELVQGALEEVKASLQAAESMAPKAKELAIREFTELQRRCEMAEEKLQSLECSGALQDEEEAQDGDEETQQGASPQAPSPEELAQIDQQLRVMEETLSKALRSPVTMEDISDHQDALDEVFEEIARFTMLFTIAGEEARSELTKGLVEVQARADALQDQMQALQARARGRNQEAEEAGEADLFDAEW